MTVQNILKIDRSKPLDLMTFVGEGWSIWKGLADSDGLSGDEDQDNRSLALTEIDISKIELETTLKRGESSINGEQKQKRLKDDGRIRLDAKVFQTFWEDQSKIPEAWKKRVNGNIQYICFDGTILRIPGGDRSVLYLCWGGGSWSWDVGWLDVGFSARGPSALLAK